MNTSRLVHIARLGLASGIGLFTFAFVTSAVGNIGYDAVSTSIGAVAGVVTFIGGTRIA